MELCIQMKRETAFLVLLIALLLIGGCTTLEDRTISTSTEETTAVETLKPIEAELESCPPMDAELRADMDRIEEQVMTLRGLQATAPVERILLTQSQLRQRIIDDFLAEYSEEEARDDVLVFSLLGLLPQDFDLYNFYIDFYEEQIGGFYDDSQEEIAVVCGVGFSGWERLLYSHEFTHALQDQTYDLDEGLGFNRERCELDSQRCAGIQALLEGDATVLELQWMNTYASHEDLVQVMELINNLDTPVFNSAPPFLSKDLLFSYEGGMNFVNSIFREGKWAAVDAVYQDPPNSTEQILHPERYPNDDPVQLIIPDALDNLESNWGLLEADTLGEWRIQLVLNTQLLRSVAEPAAEGWGGDVYHVYHNDSNGDNLLLLVTQWDTIKDVREFSAAFVDYLEARFGEQASTSSLVSVWDLAEEYIYFERKSNQTIWILAPDSDTAEVLRQAVSLPVEQE
jgi:hypothetical protein